MKDITLGYYYTYNSFEDVDELRFFTLQGVESGNMYPYLEELHFFDYSPDTGKKINKEVMIELIRIKEAERKKDLEIRAAERERKEEEKKRVVQEFLNESKVLEGLDHNRYYAFTLVDKNYNKYTVIDKGDAVHLRGVLQDKHLDGNTISAKICPTKSDIEALLLKNGFERDTTDFWYDYRKGKVGVNLEETKLYTGRLTSGGDKRNVYSFDSRVSIYYNNFQAILTQLELEE